MLLIVGYVIPESSKLGHGEGTFRVSRFAFLVRRKGHKVVTKNEKRETPDYNVRPKPNPKENLFSGASKTPGGSRRCALGFADTINRRGMLKTGI